MSEIETTAPETPAPPASSGGRIAIFGIGLSLGALFARGTPLALPGVPALGSLLAWGTLLALLVLLALGLSRSQKGPVSKGEQAPEFLLATFSGEEIRMAALRGKVVVVNFSAC